MVTLVVVGLHLMSVQSTVLISRMRLHQHQVLVYLEARNSLAAVSSNSYGYFGGGYILYSPGNPDYLCTIDRLDFSNETLSTPGTGLPQARRDLAAVSSNSYGYFGGGNAPPYVCTIDRIDFSNDTVLDIGDLSQARGGLAAVSSNSYGYFGGGSYPPGTPDYLCTIDRLDFSNDTVTVPGTGLPQARGSLAATSSNSYGYFGGGSRTLLESVQSTVLISLMKLYQHQVLVYSSKKWFSSNLK